MPEGREEGGRGRLYLCATPIGNLEDITLRVLRVLKEADLIAAEDTRRTRKLLAHYGIDTPLTSYREQNREAKGRELVEFMAAGRDVALVTDAGMPSISDPGVDLVKLAVERGIEVVALPGACALVTALAVSGLPTAGFVFAGFLPRRSQQRREALEELKDEPRTIVFHEAPHRLLGALEDMRAVFGEREAAVGRELTKIHEEVVRGSLDELVAHFRAAPPRGELTVVVRGMAARPRSRADEEALVQRLGELVASGLGKKDSISLVARELGLPRRRVYAAALRMEKEAGGQRGVARIVRPAHQGRDGDRRDGCPQEESGRRDCGREDSGGGRDPGRVRRPND